MSAQAQEWIVLAIVAAICVGWAYRIFCMTLADPLSKWLLKRGQVKRAMTLRKLARA